MSESRTSKTLAYAIRGSDNTTEVCLAETDALMKGLKLSKLFPTVTFSVVELIEKPADEPKPQASNTSRFRVERTRCDCHAETCACADYTLWDGETAVAKGMESLPMCIVANCANAGVRAPAEPSERKQCECGAYGAHVKNPDCGPWSAELGRSKHGTNVVRASEPPDDGRIRVPTNKDVDFVIQVYKCEEGIGCYADSPTHPGVHAIGADFVQAATLAAKQIPHVGLSPTKSEPDEREDPCHPAYVGAINPSPGVATDEKGRPMTYWGGKSDETDGGRE